MKIAYLSSARIPDDWAHVIQILKMCEAFAVGGNEVVLIVPMRARTRVEDPYEYAGVKSNFKIIKLPCIDLFPGTQSSFWYKVRTLSFLFFVRMYLFCTQYDFIFTRELLATGMKSCVFEIHDISPIVVRTIPKLQKVKLLVGITQGLIDDMVAAGFPREKTVVAPDGVSLEDFLHTQTKEDARKRLGLSIQSTIALYIGLLDTWKGTGSLFGAAKLLAPDITTVVIGGYGGEWEKLKKDNPDVHFLGFHPYTELPHNQSAADVLILPNSGLQKISAKYTSPLKLFTYMASGIPIVASDLPSLREVLNETNAVLVTPDSPQALAEGIRFVCDNPEESSARAARARIDVQKYSWKMRSHTILTALSAQEP